MPLPKLSAQSPIARPGSLQPTSGFLEFMEETRRELIRAFAELVAVNDRQDATITDLASIVSQIQATAAVAQAAQQAANNAQAAADGSGAVSGSNTNPAVNLFADGIWIEGPQVDFTGVIAGTLTISGTGPQQDADVSITGPSNFAGEYRVVEIDGVTETVVFAPSPFVVSNFGEGGCVVGNESASAVQAFSAARTSTGAISYRLDARKVSGDEVNSLLLYLFARRTA